MSKVRSIRDGNTPAERAILNAQTGTVAAPSGTGGGWSLKGADYVYFYASFAAGTTEAVVVPYYYSDIAEQWFAGTPITFNAVNGLWAVQEVRGQTRLTLAVTSQVGGGSLSVWVGGTREGEE